MSDGPSVAIVQNPPTTNLLRSRLCPESVLKPAMGMPLRAQRRRAGQEPMPTIRACVPL